VAEVPLPATLRLTILRRLGLLPDDTLEALRAASILGSSLSLTDLATITGRSVLELSSSLAEAIRARVLEDDGDGLRFRHDLLREALYEDLPMGVRVALHREAGRRLAAGGAPALRVAEHLVRGAAAGDGEAVAWLARAAREAAPRSPATAADLLERALALADPTDPDRDRLLAERADALMWSGRLPDAEAACRSLLERGPGPSPAATARLLLARTLATQGRMGESLQELERLRQAPGLGDELRAGAGAAEAMARLQLGDLEGAATAAGQARAAALPGDHPAVILALTALAIVEELRADLPRALQTADEAVRLADRSPRRRGHQEVVHLTRGNILMELDRLQEARSTLQTGRRIGEELGVLGGASMTTEKTYLMGKFARVALRTRHIDYNGRLCMVSAAAANKKAFGIDRAGNPWADLLETEVIVVAGTNIAECFPVAMQYFWGARDRGAKLVVVDPRETAMARTADEHVALRPGTDAAFYNGMLHVTARDGLTDERFIAEHTVGWEAVRDTVAAYTPERVGEICGLDPRQVERVAHLWGRARRCWAAHGRGLEQHLQGVENVLSCINVSLATGQLGRPGAGRAVHVQ
jgi:tetratricopeptide (TPR) repeat protein